MAAMSQITPAPSNVETEHRLTALETRLDVILPTLATKADIAEVKTTIAEAKSSLLIWGITTAVAVVAILVSLLFFLARELEAMPAGDSAALPTLRTGVQPASGTTEPTRGTDPRRTAA